MRRSEFLYALIGTFIIAGILTLQLFWTHGQETTFDGPTHMQTIAQFTRGLRDGDFPVRWGDGFARYGMPIPLVSQQVTAYLGSGLNLLLDDVQLSYRLVFFIGAWISVMLMYYFLRLHVGMYGAVAGSFLFHFAPYRIINIYIRGALPEFFASVFVLLALIGAHMMIKNHASRMRRIGSGMWIGGLLGLLLTHPFVCIIALPLLAIYILYLLMHESRVQQIGNIKMLSGGAVIAGLLGAYYLIPLLREIHYFNYAQALTHYVPNQFIELSRFITDVWDYYGGDVATRGNIIHGGMVEGAVLIGGMIVSVWSYAHSRKLTLLILMTSVALMYVMSMQSLTEVLYVHTPLGNIQHPWRMLSGYILVIPIVCALLIDRIPRKLQFLSVIICMFVIAGLRFPQLYTKNALMVDEGSYYVTHENTHGLIMNTVWMGDAREYPFQSHKGAIIEGAGAIQSRTENNSEREYRVSGDTALRMVDYTFYFPGWHAYVDGVETPIQFQDPSYRGIITYEVPTGNHTVKVVFENTRFRALGNIITGLGVFVFLVYMYFHSKIFAKIV